MPEISEIVGSDDEYQDAVSDESAINSTTTNTSPTTSAIKTPTAGANIAHEVIVDELIKEQENLKLNSDIPDEAFKDTASGENVEKEDETKSPEYIHEQIDEEELAEKEKSLTSEELKANQEKAGQMKLEANEMFKNDQAAEAIDLYTEALKICPLKETKDRAVLFGNRAAAKIKLDSKKSAIEDCSKAIELWPDYVRALLRYVTR